MELLLIVIAVLIIMLLISINTNMHKQNAYNKEMIKRLDLLIKKDRHEG